MSLFSVKLEICEINFRDLIESIVGCLSNKRQYLVFKLQPDQTAVVGHIAKSWYNYYITKWPRLKIIHVIEGLPKCEFLRGMFAFVVQLKDRQATNRLH